MPQESLRSVVYRSFVTCDDPKGVADCKTIRKSKQKKTHSNTAYSSYEEGRKYKVVPKESTAELQKLSSFQIMEVCRGAEKLNEVVDSWSNRPSLDKQSKYIAKDLLRGALDLQDSLLMLTKLQQASKRHKDLHAAAVEKEDTDEFMGSHHQFGVLDNQTKERCSRDCYDELREVIRESFARQNLLPAKEKDNSFCMDLPSSRSSRSSLICSYSSNCSPSSEKPKGSNLIAKLMGLEEVPSKGTNSIAFKQMEKEKLQLDIDLPRPKKKPAVQERRTLEEMIETMQFKGPVGRKNSFDGKCHSGHDFSVSRKSLAVDGPPIVIMKPLHIPHLQPKDLRENHSINEEKHIIKSRNILMPQTVRKISPTQVPRPPKQKLNRDEDKHSGKFRPKEDRVSAMKISHSKPLVQRKQKKVTVIPKIYEKSKVASNTRKRAENKEGKCQGPDRIQDLGKLTTLKHLSKAVGESNVSKSQVARGKVVAARNESIKRTSLKPSIPNKNLEKSKPKIKPSAALVENIQSDDDLTSNIEINILGSLMMKGTASKQATKEMINASHVSISGNTTSSPGESSNPILSKGDVNDFEDGCCIPRRSLDGTKGCKRKTNTRHLLLSSVSFLNHVEDLFDTGSCDPYKVLPADDSEVVDDTLLLDCAKEILERKSHRYSSTINYPFSRTLLIKPKCNVHIQELVGEISDDIEYLRNYSKSCGDAVVVDRIYPMLERDLRWNEEVTGGVWDLGWRRDGYTMEAVNEVVHDIEKLVLSEFVADVVIEFMPH